MDAMTIFRRCREAGADIEALEMKIRQRRDALTQVTQTLDTTGGGKGPAGDRMAGVVAAIADLDARIRDRRERQAVEIAAACVLMDTLEEKYARVLHLYYVKGLTVRAAARRMKYSEGYVRKLKREAEDAAGALDPETVRASLPDWYTRRGGGERE